MNEKKLHQRLVDRYKSKEASDEELMVFFHLLRTGELDQALNDSFPFAGLEEATDTFAADAPRNAIVRRFPTWARVAVAASVVGLIVLVAVLMSKGPQHDEGEKRVQSMAELAKKSGTILQFPDGGSMPLDSLGAGLSTAIGELVVKKIGSAHLLINTQPGATTVGLHSVATPRGSQYRLTLPDGTDVWLNAATSIQFSIAATERTVNLSGEAYFEVAHDSKKPFYVRLAKGSSIKVVGTQFNVHAYDDEPVIATLVEGSVEVSAPQRSALLNPGQAAAFHASGELSISDANPEQAVAWKNGLFHFDRQEVRVVMKQLQKWYDVEVVYEGSAPTKQFVGKMSRSSSINDIIEILRLSGIPIRTEGKKVIVGAVE